MHAWPLAQAIGQQDDNAVRRLWRAVFCPGREEIVKRFQETNRRTPVQLFCAAALAGVLYKVSSLPHLLIGLWLAWLMATDIAVNLLRRRVIRNPPSRWDVPVFVAVNFIVCGAWCVMPVLLEFRGSVEMQLGLFVLMGVLISCSVIAAQGEIWIVKFAVVGGAMVASDVASLCQPGAHADAIGVLIIKLLFLFNFGSLIWHWHHSAKREARMQAELKLRRQHAEDLAAARDMFLAHMSHEIRSPLAGVTLMASLLTRLENVPEDQRQMIEQIDAGGQAILNLLNTVLDYSKIEAGKISLAPAPTNIRGLLDGVVAPFQDRAKEASIQLELSVEDAVPTELILDAARLKQIATNLVSNAVRHSPGAGVHVRAGYDGPGRTLQLEVIDTGPGVEQGMKHRLFMPCEQAGNAESGTSLGLAISRGLVELMGGAIGYRDTPGGGATFWFRIPAAGPEASLGLRTRRHLAAT